MKKYLPTLRDYFLIILAAFIQAFSLRTFFIPANLASGGVSGIAQLINHFTGWQIGLMILIGNIPLFILGWRFLGGHRFALRTAVAIFTYSTLIDVLPNTPLFSTGGAGAALIRDLRGDIFLNTLYGAIVSGVGYGLIYRARGTSGGSDILARILNNWRGIPITQSYLFVDSAVILGAGFVFGWKQALYAMIALYVSGLVAETTLEGSRTVRTAMIVTSESEAVSQRVLDELQRGVTILEGAGAYTKADRPGVVCVITRAEVSTLKAIVNECDRRVHGHRRGARGVGRRDSSH
ncbi:MAG: YitT family protein [Anaerolineales bacterium]